MKRMIHGRVSWFLESCKLLPNVVFGFRGKLSALGCIVDLINDLEINKNIAAVFLNIEEAYDNGSSLVVVSRLEELGITGRAQAFIRYFYNRSN